MGYTAKTLNWLLEDDNLHVRYRALTELQNLSHDHPDIAQLKPLLSESSQVQKIMDKMHPDGYWLQQNPRTKVWYGKGTEYGSYATTHFCLAYLSEMGLDRSHPLIEKAADRYLNLQAKDGDFFMHLSCLLGYNIRNFIHLGFRNDRRLKKAIKLMVDTKRHDGGYLCELHEGKYKTKEAKSCIRGSVKTLMAFAELPEYWDHPRCKDLVEYFLRREGIFTTKDPTVVAQKDFTALSFPLTWGANLFELLLAMSMMGYGKRRELKRAWQALNSKRLDNGRFLLDATPSQAPFKVGKKGEENKWVTFYVLLAEKFKKEVQTSS